jgi:putative tryptophan/tyrosine transport system substrate-binding protein
MHRRGFLAALCVAPLAARAADARLYRIGVVYRGGPYAAAIDGLRDGLKDLGFAEGKQFVFHVRAVSSDLKGVEAATRALEMERVDVIYSVGTTTTLAVKRAAHNVPIVFYAGADPVALGLIANYRQPGGRLTGIYSRFSDLTAKRLELLSRAITFYNPDNPVAMRSITMAREAGRRLNVELIERKVASVEELRRALDAMRPGEADALFYAADGMVISQADMVIAAANAIKLPIMLSEQTSVAKGALASYAVSYYACGRLAAKDVQRIVQGANPGELPIEQIDTPYFVVNLKSAAALGLAIPQSVLARADEIIR